jgi:hypothetical protein
MYVNKGYLTQYGNVVILSTNRVIFFFGDSISFVTTYKININPIFNND